MAIPNAKAKGGKTTPKKRMRGGSWSKGGIEKNKQRGHSKRKESTFRKGRSGSGQSEGRGTQPKVGGHRVEDGGGERAEVKQKEKVT